MRLCVVPGPVGVPPSGVCLRASHLRVFAFGLPCLLPAGGFCLSGRRWQQLSWVFYKTSPWLLSSGVTMCDYPLLLLLPLCSKGPSWLPGTSLSYRSQSPLGPVHPPCIRFGEPLQKDGGRGREQSFVRDRGPPAVMEAPGCLVALQPEVGPCDHPR